VALSDCVVVIVLKTGEHEERYESTIAELKARLKIVSYSSCFIFHFLQELLSRPWSHRWRLQLGLTKLSANLQPVLLPPSLLRFLLMVSASMWMSCILAGLTTHMPAGLLVSHSQLQPMSQTWACASWPVSVASFVAWTKLFYIEPRGCCYCCCCVEPS